MASAGFSTPVEVSPCTRATMRYRRRFKARATASGSTGSPGGKSRTSGSRPWRAAISATRWEKAPFTRTRTGPRSRLARPAFTAFGSGIP